MSTDIDKPEFIISYIFNFDNSEQVQFDVNIRTATMHRVNVVVNDADTDKKLPQWALLENNKCPNCPLDGDKAKYCPASTSLIDLIDFFAARISTEQVNVVVKTQQRDYSKRIDLQNAVSALMGICMVTSGCPVLGYLKPLARFHLPFAGTQETFYRNVSYYLTVQLLQSKNGGNGDWNLNGIKKPYEEIALVNNYFIKRLRGLKVKDSTLNALVKLNCFTDFLTFFDDKFILETLSELIPKDVLRIKPKKFLD